MQYSKSRLERSGSLALRIDCYFNWTGFSEDESAYYISDQ